MNRRLDPYYTAHEVHRLRLLYLVILNTVVRDYWSVRPVFHLFVFIVLAWLMQWIFYLFADMAFEELYVPSI